MKKKSTLIPRVLKLGALIGSVLLWQLILVPYVYHQARLTFNYYNQPVSYEQWAVYEQGNLLVILVMQFLALFLVLAIWFIGYVLYGLVSWAWQETTEDEDSESTEDTAPPCTNPNCTCIWHKPDAFVGGVWIHSKGCVDKDCTCEHEHFNEVFDLEKRRWVLVA